MLMERDRYDHMPYLNFPPNWPVKRTCILSSSQLQTLSKIMSGVHGKGQACGLVGILCECTGA